MLVKKSLYKYILQLDIEYVATQKVWFFKYFFKKVWENGWEKGSCFAKKFQQST